MYEDSYLTPIRSISCLVHKKQKATHLCIDLNCLNNPVLCSLCFQDSKFRASHLTHENALKPVSQAVQFISDMIKRHIKPTQSVFEKTLGNRDNDLIRNNLEKMDYLTEEIQNRISSVKMQMDLEIELLTKEFQRQILLEKQEFLRRLDDYKRTFFSNLEALRRESSDLMNFETSLKFYSNSNTLLLKLSTEAQKRSLDWILQQKKTLSKITKHESSYMQSQSYSTLSSYIGKVNEMNMMIKPVWMGQKKELQSEKQLKNWIKSNIESWVSLPDLKDLSKSVSQQQSSHYSSTNDYRSGNSYSPQNVTSLYGNSSSNPYSNNMI